MSQITVQFHNQEATVDEVENFVKEELIANDISLDHVSNLDIYFKPESNDIYYVATMDDGKTYRNIEALKFH